jgi:hypothetical protein
VVHRKVRLAVAAALGACVLVAPVATVAAASGASAGTTVSGTMIRAAGNLSTNWSGNGEPGSFTSIGGSWTVPSVTPAAGVTDYSSTWIGIDGLANRFLIQTGTESDVIGGVVHYDAWTEVLPQAERVVAHMAVSPGNHMTAAINQVSGRTWTITVTDRTTGASYTQTRRYRGPGASAEWIEERPQVGRSLATLAPYGSTTFTGLTADGGVPRLSAPDAISMIGNTGSRVISTPSALSTSGTAFTVAYGSTAPPAPEG